MIQPMRLIAHGIVAAALTLAGTTPAAAQTQRSTGAPRLVISEHAIASGLASAAAAQRLKSRDTVVNGVVIGAIVGGISAAVFGGFLCHALAEEGDPPCWRSLGPVLALGAGAGAAIGAGVDVLHSRSGRIVLVRF